MENIKGHIVAIGGGGFTALPPNLLLEEFILSLVPKKLPKICFIPTATAESPGYIIRFYRTFTGRAIPTDLTIFETTSLPRNPSRSSDIVDFIAGQDIIYVGGGNTANLLSIWRAHGLDKALRDAWAAGAVLSGISAGMICWFRDSITDSYGPLRPLGDGLGFIHASACPHYDGEKDRRPVYQKAIAEGMPGGYAADDGVALHFHGTQLVQAVSSRPEASAYRIEQINGQVQETRITTRYLGTNVPVQHQ